MKWKKKPDNDWLFNLKNYSNPKIQSEDKTEFDEPSILEYLYTFIEDDCKFGLDVGAWGASNVDYISDKLNWRRLQIDGQEKGSYKETYKVEWMTKENIISILNKYKCPKPLEVISIDLDNMDYWILEQILLNGFKSKIIIFEFNPMYKYNECYTKAYYPNATKSGRPFKWEIKGDDGETLTEFRPRTTSIDGIAVPTTPVLTGNAGSSSWYGASLGAFIKLGKRFGYELVYISPAKINKDGDTDLRYHGFNSNNGWLLNKEYIREDDLIHTPDSLHTPYIETFKEKGNRVFDNYFFHSPYSLISNDIKSLKKYFLTNGMIKKV